MASDPEAGGVVLSEAMFVNRLRRASNEEKLRLAGDFASQGGIVGGNEVKIVNGAIDTLRYARLQAVWSQLEPSVFPAPKIAYRSAALAYHFGDLLGSFAWIERVPKESLLRDRAERLRVRILDQSSVSRSSVAVLLPLSGRFAVLGKEMLAAIKLAKAEFPKVKLHVLDTRGDPVYSALAVEQAVFEHKAIAILGPIGVVETRAAARRAATLGIPIAALSAWPSLSNQSGFSSGIFHLWSSPMWEAAEAARTAVELGYDKLAVLVPRDEQGGAQARMFRKTANRLGVAVVRAGSYDPTATHLASEMKAFLGLNPSTNRRLRRHLSRYGRKNGWKTFSPDIDFEVLFIPDRHDRAALVASFLPYFNVEVRARDFVDLDRLKRKHHGRIPQVVQLIGGSGWHHQKLIAGGGSAVNGALIVDVFSGGPTEDYAYEAGAVFAQRFLGLYGRHPSSAAAQAYDATQLVLRATRGIPPRQPRSHFVRVLAQARLGQGACGPARVRPEGTVDRSAVVLRIESGDFVLHDY